MNKRNPDIRPLILMGGHSSRMGYPKSLLPFPDGRPAFEHTIETIRAAIPNAGTIYLSLRDRAQLEDIQDTLQKKLTITKDNMQLGSSNPHMLQGLEHLGQLEVIFDDKADIGPASGLLAAHQLSSQASWLVIACDYPLLRPAAIHQLLSEYQHQPPVTCFVNQEGFSEPLISIWSSEALEQLKRNVERGKSGLSNVIKDVNGKQLAAHEEIWIKGVNTKKEWEEAMLIWSLSQEEEKIT